MLAISHACVSHDCLDGFRGPHAATLHLNPSTPRNATPNPSSTLAGCYSSGAGTAAPAELKLALCGRMNTIPLLFRAPSRYQTGASALRTPPQTRSNLQPVEIPASKPWASPQTGSWRHANKTRTSHTLQTRKVPASRNPTDPRRHARLARRLPRRATGGQSDTCRL
jgi:hypothetical protein